MMKSECGSNVSSVLSSFEGMKKIKFPLEKYKKDIIIK